MYENKFYKKYAKNVYSQNGEDGILEELLKKHLFVITCIFVNFNLINCSILSLIYS